MVVGVGKQIGFQSNPNALVHVRKRVQIGADFESDFVDAARLGVSDPARVVDIRISVKERYIGADWLLAAVRKVCRWIAI